MVMYWPRRKPEPIPSVVYDPITFVFFSTATGWRMNAEFHARWRERWAEFPRRRRPVDGRKASDWVLHDIERRVMVTGPAVVELTPVELGERRELPAGALEAIRSGDGGDFGGGGASASWSDDASSSDSPSD